MFDRVIMDKVLREKTYEALHKLDRWVQRREMTGYDPYDLKGTELYLWSADLSRRRFLPARLIRGGFAVLDDIFPMGMRRLFGVRPSINAKAMGLFARAYLNLYNLESDRVSLKRAIKCLDWLEENITPGYSGPCWGYPFNWQSTVFIPKGTPSSVVSWTVGDAFWQMYRVTGEKRYLDKCAGVCEFFIKDLNRDIASPDQLCFSYTPLDRTHVFNATLFVGEFLIRVGHEIGNDNYKRTGTAATNYVVSNQNSDGSWAYFGPEDTQPVTIDHYHTGFVLRMLKSISDVTGDQRYEGPLKKGFEFYWNELFEPSGLPRYFLGAVYPVNIHSIAESLLCLKLFDCRYRDTSDRLHWILKWSLNNMQDESGYFYFMKHQNRTVKIPFMRWGQAWMLLALSDVLRKYL
jgi:hypothetical protein